MAKRWTVQEDAFLLRYHGIPGGADFIASHDLGRPQGAGERRLKFLTESGARFFFAEMRIAELDYNRCSRPKNTGFEGSAVDEREYWQEESKIGLAGMKGGA